MQKNRLLTSRSLFLSIMLHFIIGVVLVFSFEFSPAPEPVPKPAITIVKAATVDKKQVEKELARLKARENKKIADEIKRQQELEQKAENAKKKRLAEEKKLAEIKRKKKQEEEQRKAEAARLKKLEKEKKELEKKRKLEAKKKAEAERQKKAAEEKRKAEAEQKRKAREQALQEELRAELEAEQQQRDQSLLAKYIGLVQNEIENNFNRLGLPDGLSCVILIRILEGGKVAEASIVNPSGNELFDRRAVTAVYSASPLPVPEETRLFEQMRNIRFTFEP